MTDLIHTQPDNHVKWANTIYKIGDKRYEIHFTATISSLPLSEISFSIDIVV
jgi:hypothetical protein